MEGTGSGSPIQHLTYELLRAVEFGVKPFSAIYPKVYGDIIRVGVRTY